MRMKRLLTAQHRGLLSADVPFGHHGPHGRQPDRRGHRRRAGGRGGRGAPPCAALAHPDEGAARSPGRSRAPSPAARRPRRTSPKRRRASSSSSSLSPIRRRRPGAASPGRRGSSEVAARDRRHRPRRSRGRTPCRSPARVTAATKRCSGASIQGTAAKQKHLRASARSTDALQMQGPLPAAAGADAGGADDSWGQWVSADAELDSMMQ